MGSSANVKVFGEKVSSSSRTLKEGIERVPLSCGKPTVFSWPFTAFDDYTGATCKFCQKFLQFVYYLSELSKHKKLA